MTDAATDDGPLAAMAVCFDGVSVRFPRRAAPTLIDVGFRLAPGEQVLLIGASGSGKTTVLQAISGVVPHTVRSEMTGDVTVCGASTRSTSVVGIAGAVGVLSQDPSSGICLPDVEQEVALPLENLATPPALISARIDEALEIVGAGGLRGRRTAQLSGGQAQRVALAATIAAEPAVLLLDEPTSMLDPAGVAAVREALRASSARYRPAMVLVEHRLDDLAGPAGLAGLPPRAIVLGEGGTVVADGPTSRVLREHGPALLAAGCWLPLDAEWDAIGGGPDGPGSPAAAGLLEVLARPADPDTGEATTLAARPSAEPVLTARGLAVGRRDDGRAGGARLLTSIDLSIHSREIVALLGANGVGKTSLLLTLAGLLPPVAGTVTGPRPGMVFQNPEHQFLATTVRGEIGYGLQPDEAAVVVPALLRSHRLEQLAEQNPFRLSGGEKRRLSLAAMLAHARPCLLLDEPTLGLDRRDTIATIEALRDAAEQRAVVLASHDLRTVVTLARRVVVLSGGGVIADGPTAEVLRDRRVLAAAGLTLPPLITAVLERFDSECAIRRVLDRLNGPVAGLPCR
jgi:energy-coupling factor transporter ATP-binding protein EcfA2